jgi:hypothetical protein
MKWRNQLHVINQAEEPAKEIFMSVNGNEAMRAS